MTREKISIVICTHKRADLLEGAVQSLILQSASRASFEVIVVDNEIEVNPITQEIVEKASEHISIRYLHEKQIGLSNARNTGGKAAISEYVMYLDDDGRANPQYVESLIRIIGNCKPDIGGGPGVPFYLTNKPPWFLDRYGSFAMGEVARYLHSDEYLRGGNIFYRRTLLDEVGWFNPNLGLKGKKRRYGEETLVIMEAWELHPDLKVYYDPELLIYHHVPAWKMSVWNWLRISYLHGKSQAYFWIPTEKIKTAQLRAPLALIIDLMLLARKFSLGIVLRNRQEYKFWQNYVVENISCSVESMGVHIKLNKDLLFFWLSRTG